MALLKSARNGLTIGITSDTVGVIRNYAVGEDNKIVFGGIRRSLYDSAKKQADKPVTLVSLPDAEEIKPAQTEVVNDPKPEVDPASLSVNVIDDEQPDKPRRKGRSNRAASEASAPPGAPAPEAPAPELEGASTVDEDEGLA